MPEWALAFSFDIVLRGREATPFEDDDEDDEPMSLPADALADRRAVPRASGCPGRTGRSSSRTARRARSGSAAACTTAPASRSPTRWSRRGRPTRTAASTIPADRAAAAATTFRGFGRCPTDDDGGYAILTLKPGAVPGAGRRAAGAAHRRLGLRPRPAQAARDPHLLRRRGEANAADPVLGSSPTRPARATLVAERDRDGYRFDIRLQGERETVFFDV